MRYEYWDVILFPTESQIPIQEFRTACYVNQGQDDRRLHTLTCFVPSLCPSSPFRISVHSWIKPTPSSYIESKRNPEQRVVYTIRVVIDGFRIFHDYFEKNSSWPQQIRNENRRDYEDTKPTFSCQDPAFRGSPLLFPAFHHDVLSQIYWDAQESNGRIKVIVAEELISESASGVVKSGAVNDLVCFSFQHAPKDVLEQAGISWPIPNLLYRASSGRPLVKSEASSRNCPSQPSQPLALNPGNAGNVLLATRLSEAALARNASYSSLSFPDARPVLSAYSNTAVSPSVGQKKKARYVRESDVSIECQSSAFSSLSQRERGRENVHAQSSPTPGIKSRNKGREQESVRPKTEFAGVGEQLASSTTLHKQARPFTDEELAVFGLVGGEREVSGKRKRKVSKPIGGA